MHFVDLAFLEEKKKKLRIFCLCRSTVTGTPNAKSSPATPRVSRGVVRPSGDSIPSLQNGRFSVDRSPNSVTPKGKVERTSPKPSTPTEVSFEEIRFLGNLSLQCLLLRALVLFSCFFSEKADALNEAVFGASG